MNGFIENKIYIKSIWLSVVSYVTTLLCECILFGNIQGMGYIVTFSVIMFPLFIVNYYQVYLLLYLLRINVLIYDKNIKGIIIPLLFFIPLYFIVQGIIPDFMGHLPTNYMQDFRELWIECSLSFFTILFLFLWQLVYDYKSEAKDQQNLRHKTRCTYDNITENNISSAKAKCNAGSRVVAYPVFIVMTGALLQFIIQVFFTSGNLQYGLFVTLGYIAYCVINNRWLKRYINKRIVLFPEVILPLIALTCWLAANWRSLQVFCMITVSAIENMVRTIF